MSSFTFANVFNYMNHQYPGAVTDINGDDVLQELRKQENITKPTSESEPESDLEIPAAAAAVSNVCNTYLGEVNVFLYAFYNFH